MTSCPQCNGSPMFIGRLGASDAFRCRQCGWDWSEPAEDDEDVGAPLCDACGIEMPGDKEDGDLCDACAEDEDDGQPDEAQEWHDFNPDC